ncbi:RrF2 family transcriptional regulator [Brevibacillus gelatini]
MPLFLRRVMAQLIRADIVAAKEGRVGGYYMTRCPKELTLADIYRALPEEREEDRQEELDCGEVGAQLDRHLEALMNQAERQLIRFLGQYTLADVMDSIGIGQIGPSEELLEIKQENRLL